jgi:hypothetical protein
MTPPPPGNILRVLCIIVALAIAHFVAATGLFFHTFGTTMRSMDSGEMPGVIDRLSNVGADILLFPFTQVAALTHVSGSVEWLLLFANSLLWGIFLYTVFLGCRRLVRPS